MSSGRKPRYTLFSVGRNKASPARNASIKRASLRASVIRTEAPKLHLAFEDAGEALPDATGCKEPANDSPSLTERANPSPRSLEAMKDAPLPSLPDDAAPARKPRDLASRPPPPSDVRPTRPPPTSSMPPPARRPPHHSATMPQSRPPPPPQQGNFFRRLTSKIRSSSSTPHQSSQSQPSRDAPQRKVTILRIPKAPPPAPPPNDFTSAEQRQAALRARGLIPASSSAPRRFRDAEGFMMPLSEQEAEIDRRFAVVVPRSSSEEEDSGASEARRIREAWLAKQHDAAAPSAGESTDASASARTSGDADAVGEGTPRKSDAMTRASKDGTVGDKSPARATFVRAASLSPNTGEINIGGGSLSPPPPGSPFEATVEDFHTAPNSPAKVGDVLSGRQSGSADRPRAASPPAPARVPPNSTAHTQEPSTPSSHSSAVTEKVSRWLRTSSDTPAPTAAPSSAPNTRQTHTDTHASPLSESPRQSSEHNHDEAPTPVALSTPTGTVRARKEKPPPIVITTHRQDSNPKVPQAAQVIAVAIAVPSDSEATSSEGRPSLEMRGRGGSTGPPRLAHDISASSNGTTTTSTSSGTVGTSTTGGRSRTNTVPALSPTRTVSSSGASSTLPTPTTTSCARDASISRGSTSQSSDGGHETHVRARRGTAGELNLKAKGKTPAGVIPEEYSETEPSSEGGEGEFGVQPPPLPSSTQAVPRPRPQTNASGRAQMLEAQAKANNRISFSLFGKKSLDSQMPRDTRTSSSMLNLRRAFTSSKPRPKSTLALSPVAEQGQGVSELGVSGGVGRKKSKMFDASHLPASPTFAPSSYPQSAPRQSTSSVSSNGKTTGVGLRPRQAVAPTMHSRGSILHQAHFIEDEESRRLSEMAFLT